MEDEDGLVLEETTYACGCRSTTREYHDGSHQRRVIRHDGKVLMDQLNIER
jgi:hypothetical protein